MEKGDTRLREKRTTVGRTRRKRARTPTTYGSSNCGREPGKGAQQRRGYILQDGLAKREAQGCIELPPVAMLTSSPPAQRQRFLASSEPVDLVPRRCQTPIKLVAALRQVLSYSPGAQVVSRAGSERIRERTLIRNEITFNLCRSCVFSCFWSTVLTKDITKIKEGTNGKC